MNSPILTPVSVKSNALVSYQLSPHITPTFHRSFESSPSPELSIQRISSENYVDYISRSNEVDFSINPTELFRWINYRRWDGARTRITTYPEEVSIWISRRKGGNGRLMWRFLPLHLVCQKSYYINYPTRTEVDDDSGMWDSNEHLKEAELLVDDLLNIHPHGAQEKDYDGRLPLHLCVHDIDESHLPNDMIITSLLLSYPSAVHVRDNYGRTPLDILREKHDKHSNLERSLRSMMKAIEMINTIKRDLQQNLKHRDLNFKRNNTLLSKEKTLIDRQESAIPQEDNDTSNHLCGKIDFQGENKRNGKGHENHSCESISLDISVDQLLSCFKDLVAEYDMLLESNFQYERLVGRIQSNNNRSMEFLRRIDTVTNRDEFYKQILVSSESESELIQQLSCTHKRGSNSLLTIRNKFSKLCSKVKQTQRFEFKMGHYENITFETPVKNQSVDSLKPLIHHRPFPTVKSPILLELLQQRAKKTDSKHSNISSRDANSPDYTDDSHPFELRHEELENKDSIEVDPSSDVSCSRSLNFDQSSGKENVDAITIECSKRMQESLQKKYTNHDMEVLRARYASTKRK